MERDILTPVDLLADLARLGATISASDNGKVQVRADRGDAILGQACRRWKWVLAWGLHGAETGYRWFACDSCGTLTAMARKPGGPCSMTFGCKGHSTEITQPRFAPGAPHPVKIQEPAWTVSRAVTE